MCDGKKSQRPLTPKAVVAASEQKTSFPKVPQSLTPTMAKQPEKKRSRISQEDVPAYSLEEALRIAIAIRDNLGKAPAPPLRVAAAVGLSPTSSQFRMLCGACIAYGVTSGGYNATAIALTPLGDRILRPKKEGDDLLAKREAFLRPRVISKFLRQYDGSPLPREDIASHVLEHLGVPRERTAQVFSIISAEATNLGLTRAIKGKTYVDLTGVTEVVANGMPSEQADAPVEVVPAPDATQQVVAAKPQETASFSALATGTHIRKVFVTHGKNREFVDPIKQLLQFGELEAVVSVERQSVSQPVPDKVMNDMRGCGAAIIHVEGELRLMDSEAKEVVVLNPNVLIEIGAAMALYGRRFILLVREGVKLPSNLQGLFEVRYDGDKLDGNATIRLLQAINELKKQPPLGGTP
jgi:predicted nucleotide-binding protein